MVPSIQATASGTAVSIAQGGIAPKETRASGSSPGSFEALASRPPPRPVSKESDDSPLTELPDDVHGKIAARLSAQDNARVSLTCHTLRKSAYAVAQEFKHPSPIKTPKDLQLRLDMRGLLAGKHPPASLQDLMANQRGRSLAQLIWSIDGGFPPAELPIAWTQLLQAIEHPSLEGMRVTPLKALASMVPRLPLEHRVDALRALLDAIDTVAAADREGVLARIDTLFTQSVFPTRQVSELLDLIQAARDSMKTERNNADC